MQNWFLVLSKKMPNIQRNTTETKSPLQQLSEKKTIDYEKLIVG